MSRLIRRSRLSRALGHFANGMREFLPVSYREALSEADRRLGNGRRAYDAPPPPTEGRAFAYRDRPKFGRRSTD
jgi:hypothetical protein